MSALKSDMPDCSFINGSKTKINGAANIILPAKTSIMPPKIENIIIKNLIAFEILCLLAFENQDKTRIKIIKIIIPKNTKFIY